MPGVSIPNTWNHANGERLRDGETLRFERGDGKYELTIKRTATEAEESSPDYVYTVRFVNRDEDSTNPETFPKEEPTLDHAEALMKENA